LFVTVPSPQNPCVPNPCGSNSICKNHNDQATCSCMPDFFGSPPNCRPECTINSECDATKSCVNQKCVNACIGVCGENAECRTVNHAPICSCRQGFQGDPFIRCAAIISKYKFIKLFIESLYAHVFSLRHFFSVILDLPTPDINPCIPSPCGPNSLCQVTNKVPICSCIDTYIGSPPNCRPECTINSDCASDKACINKKCRDPCLGACGLQTECHVYQHAAVCNCREGFTGNPFQSCHVVQKIGW
jgi:hypothetical protein